MRILITGANGQLGGELCRVFSRETVIPKDVPDFDLTRSGIEAQIVDARPDVIIHAGAYTDVDGAEREPDRAMAVNAGGTEQVAKAAVRAGARLVYVSTDYVFDGTSTAPYREQDRPHPINQYGLSKWKGEQAVLASGAKSLIVRTAWLYGQGGKNFVKSIMRAAHREPALKVVNDQRGCPTYAGDLASAVAFLLSREIEGVMHVTNGGQCTWYEFAVAIVRDMGLTIPVVPISSEQAGRLAKRPQYSVLNQDRLISLGLVLPQWSQAAEQFVKAAQEPLATRA